MPFPSAGLLPGTTTFPGSGISSFSFTTPFVVREFVIEGALRGALQYGLAVMRINGEWVEAEFPSWEQESAADVFFQGGTTSRFTDGAVAGSLIAAGYPVVTELSA